VELFLILIFKAVTGLALFDQYRKNTCCGLWKKFTNYF